MPEASVLYAVTSVVVVGLVVWVLIVLKTAKEPWVRPLPASTPSSAGPEASVSSSVSSEGSEEDDEDAPR